MSMFRMILGASVLAVCSGCCVMGGQYKLIEGAVDMNTEQATLPVQLIKTSGSFNVHALECGQVRDIAVPPKPLGFVAVPLAFCRAEGGSWADWQWQTFAFPVQGRTENFRGSCHIDPNNATFVIRLESQ